MFGDIHLSTDAANICIFLCIHVLWLHLGLGGPAEYDDGRAGSVKGNSTCYWSSQVRSRILALARSAARPYKSEYLLVFGTALWFFFIKTALWLIPLVLVWQINLVLPAYCSVSKTIATPVDMCRPIVHERPQNKNSWTKEEVVPNAL